MIPFMGLRIPKLCRLCFICFSYIRNEEKDAILSTNLSLLILYLTEAKKQINGIYKSYQSIY
jgi:hypothetical protein